MIDPKLLRADPEGVAANLARRGFQLDVAALRALDERRKYWQIESDRLRAQRNANAKAVGIAKAKGQDAAPLLADVEELSRGLARAEAEMASVQSALDDWMLGLPHMLHASVPDGKDAGSNIEVRRWGEPRNLAFEARDHVAIGEALGGLDFEAAVRVAGSRFAVLRGDLARLHRALAQLMLDVHTREYGYTEVYVPYLVPVSY